MENKKSVLPRITILCPEMISPYYASVVTCLHETIEKAGGIAAMQICGFETAKEKEICEQLIVQNSTDGIICMVDGDFKIDSPIPILKLSHSSVYDSAFINWSQGIEEAVEHLKAFGHTKIGFISENLTFIKLDLFKEAMAKSGLVADEKYIYINAKRFEDVGFMAAQEMISRNGYPTAVIAAYDEVALGFMNALSHKGVRFPEDISVIGMNDIPYSVQIDRPLTTISGNVSELCNIAVSLLLKKMNDPKYKVIQHIEVASNLIIRETTGKCGTATKPVLETSL